MLKRFNSLVKKLQSTNGRLEKEAFLREYSEDFEVLEIIKFLFDPYIVSGISDKKLNKFRKAELPLLTLVNTEISSSKNSDFLKTLEYFKKNSTGRDKDIQYLIEIAETSGQSDLVYSIIKHDLKLGVQAVTLNKVFGDGFVPKFDVMLAESYADNRGFLQGKDFIITEKLDGVRCLLMFNNSIPTFFSRQGQAISDLIELNEQVKVLPEEFVFDGELLLENSQGMPSKDLYRATVRITSSDSKKRGINFNIFDMVEKQGFLKGEDLRPALERKKMLNGLLREKANNCPNIKEVKMHYTGKDTDEIEKHLSFFMANGGEGVMINIADAPYQCKRTKNILKVKQFNTADVEVLSLEEGTGANRGKLGSVVVKFIGPDGKDYKCKVGSGFKLEEREFFWQNQDELLGKIIEIGYFELSRNQNNEDYSLRFPTFKHVRNDKTEISMY